MNQLHRIKQEDVGAAQRLRGATTCHASDCLLWVMATLSPGSAFVLVAASAEPALGNWGSVTLIGLDWTEVTIVGQHVPSPAFYPTITTTKEDTRTLSVCVLAEFICSLLHLTLPCFLEANKAGDELMNHVGTGHIVLRGGETLSSAACLQLNYIQMLFLKSTERNNTPAVAQI